MVNILPKVPGFGEKLGAALGGGFGEGFSSGMSNASKFAQEIALQKAKEKKDNEPLKEAGRESIDHMREILSRGKTGWNIFNYLTEGGRADRAAMDSAALNLERLAVEMQGKGTLSKPRFDYMVKRLPSSLKSDAENASILDEWGRILETKEQGSEKSKKKSKLTTDVVDQLLDEAKGDIKQAKKLAADRGYTW